MKWLAMNVGVVLLAGPGFLNAQEEHPSSGVRFVEYDDGMVAWVYAFVRAEGEPVEVMEGKGIKFGRDPVLLLSCLERQVTVVYRFDTELVGDDDGAVWIQTRFDTQPAAERQSWSPILDPWAAKEMEMGLAALGADSANPLVQMFMQTATAASMPSEVTLDFLEAAGQAAQVTIRVTDPVDGETHTDVFPLRGFAEAVAALQQRCQ